MGVLKRWRTKMIQNQMTRRIGVSSAAELIVFLVPSYSVCNGGLLSICSLATASRTLNPSAKVVLMTLPGAPILARNEMLPYDEAILRFEQLYSVSGLQNLILHIPECYVPDFCASLTEKDVVILRSIPNLHINILNQNIKLMPEREKWTKLFDLTRHITQTTAHESYTNQKVCDTYGIPLHHFSTYLDPSGWPKVPFAKKDRLIVFSPDTSIYEPKLRDLIRQRLPEYRIETVRNIRFDEYLRLIARAMAVVTFGEGLDGYFAQPAYCGTASFAVYNESFFPGRDWLDLDNVYISYDELLQRFCGDILELERNETRYYALQEALRKKLETTGLGREKYMHNLAEFYAGRYDFMPTGVAEKS